MRHSKTTNSINLTLPPATEDLDNLLMLSDFNNDEINKFFNTKRDVKAKNKKHKIKIG